MSIEDPVPVEHAPEGSVNHYTNQLRRRRYGHTAQGLVLLLPRTGLVVVPYCQVSQGGHWACVVVRSDPNRPEQRAYPVGGYNIDIGRDEIETAIEVQLSSTLISYDPPIPARDVRCY